MSPRKPPRLANWLLNHFGLTRQNPPLVGDLLEEFRAGRSTGWFWRQTLVVILIGFASNARRFRRLLAARLIGWAAAAGVAFGLWLCDLPPRLNGLIALLPAMALMSSWLWLAMPRRTRQPLSDAESREDWSGLDEHEWRFSQRILLALFAGTWFATCLMVYGIAAFLVALFGPMPLWFVIFFQVQLLGGSVTDVLAPKKEPGRAVRLLTREKP
jgi:hypothetical protein